MNEVNDIVDALRWLTGSGKDSRQLPERRDDARVECEDGQSERLRRSPLLIPRAAPTVLAWCVYYYQVVSEGRVRLIPLSLSPALIPHIPSPECTLLQVCIE